MVKKRQEKAKAIGVDTEPKGILTAPLWSVNAFACPEALSSAQETYSILEVKQSLDTRM